MRDTIVVFGGAGFIGSHLLQELSQNENLRLISADIRAPKIEIPGVDYRQQDVRDISGFDVEGNIIRIYNLAAVHTTPGHPTHEYYETNIAGATQVTAFARGHDVKEIVFASSISVYGPSEARKSESSEPAPESAYGWSKLLAENIHRSWFEEDDSRRLIIVRPAVIFGPREGGNFTRLAKLLSKGFFVYPGRKDTIKACFYVGDLIEAMLFAQSQADRYILFNACYPDRYTIKQIVNAMRRVYFGKAHTFVIPKGFLSATAVVLRPLAIAGLGIHPERILKLNRSTDIRPAWLEERGHAARNQLVCAIESWKAATHNRFD
jgi:nucleoside-diphosphate-sugar epimerase